MSSKWTATAASDTVIEWLVMAVRDARCFGVSFKCCEMINVSEETKERDAAKQENNRSSETVGAWSKVVARRTPLAAPLHA